MWIQTHEIKPKYDGERFSSSKLSGYLDYFDKAKKDIEDVD